MRFTLMAKKKVGGIGEFNQLQHDKRPHTRALRPGLPDAKSTPNAVPAITCNKRRLRAAPPWSCPQAPAGRQSPSWRPRLRADALRMRQPATHSAPTMRSAACVMCPMKRDRLTVENAGDMALRTDFQCAPLAHSRCVMRGSGEKALARS